jgi:hypothetical protein
MALEKDKIVEKEDQYKLENDPKIKIQASLYPYPIK